MTATDELETAAGREQDAARGRARAKRAAALAAAVERHPSSQSAVDALGGERPTVMLDVDLLEPHPDNPRRDLGDITELTVDIALRGVDSPLTVVPHPDTDPEAVGVYRVVIGHRRLAAAVAAGVERVPCIVRGDLSRPAQRAMMLRENSHRADLSPVEEADAIQAMLDIDGLAVTDVAKAIARSETTVRRRMHLALAPEPARVKIHAGQATLEQWEKVLDAAGDDSEVLDALAAVMGTKDFDYRIRDAAREASERRALAKGLAELEAAGIPLVDEKPPGARYVGQWPSGQGTRQRWSLDDAPAGTVAVRPPYANFHVVWLYAADEPVPSPSGTTDGEDAGEGAGTGGEAREWGDPDAAQAQADAAREEERERWRIAREEYETAREVRAAFLNGLTAATGAKFDQTRLWVVCQVVAEILAMRAISDDVLDVDADIALDLDDIVDEAVQEAKDAGDDPDTVDDYEVKSLAAPGRIERIGGPAALVRLVASGLEATITVRDWLDGLRGHEEARAYYRLLDALGYVPSSVEEAALDRPAPEGAAS